MTLSETIERALEATAGLRGAVEGADPETCQRLVLERGEIMDLFEKAHRTASGSERAACGPAVRQLQEADRDLMCACQESLTRLHAEFRRGMDSSRAKPAQGAREACLNRTA